MTLAQLEFPLEAPGVVSASPPSDGGTDLPRAGGCLTSLVADSVTLRRQRLFLLEELGRRLAGAPDELAISEEGVRLLAELKEIMVGVNGQDQAIRDNAKLTDDARAAGRKAAVKPCAAFAGKRLGLTLLDLQFLWNPQMNGRRVANGFYASDARFALEFAIMSRFGEHFIVTLPGAGSFRVRNTRGAIEGFIERVRSRFGKFNDGAAFPNGGKPRTGPHLPPSLTKKVKAEHIRYAAELVVERDHRYAELRLVVNDGGLAVATDGRRLVAIDAAGFDVGVALGRPAAAKFPKWGNVVPEFITREGRTFHCALPPTVLADSGALLTTATQAAAAIGDESDTVGLHVISGAIGLSASVARRGIQVSFRSSGVTKDSAPAAVMKLSHLTDLARQARALGVAEIGFVVTKATEPIVAILGTRGISVLMPVRTE